jgi:hypothetical protein
MARNLSELIEKTPQTKFAQNKNLENQAINRQECQRASEHRNKPSKTPMLLA